MRMRLLALPGVFRPRSDSRMLAAAVARNTAPGRLMLDLCCGTGIAGVAAALGGAEVTAVDTSRRAVLTAALNGRLNGVRIEGRRGDLFETVGGRRFDLIACNPPYVPSIGAGSPRGAARAWEGGPGGRAFIDRICAEVPAHLEPGGRLLLVHSSICGVEQTKAAMRAAGLRPVVVESRRGGLGPIVGRRAAALRSAGLLAPGQSDEEIVLFAAGLSSAQTSSAPKVSQAPASAER